MKSYVTTAIRPKNICANGCVVSIDKKHLEWLDRFLHKYSDSTTVKKMVKHLPRVGAIEVTDEGEEISLIIISKRSNPGHFRVDHYSNSNNDADFSLLMICHNNGINFADLTPNINPNNFKQVANFVIGIYVYEFLAKVEKSAKRDTIVPFNVFGQPLV